MHTPVHVYPSLLLTLAAASGACWCLQCAEEGGWQLCAGTHAHRWEAGAGGPGHRTGGGAWGGKAEDEEGRCVTHDSVACCSLFHSWHLWHRSYLIATPPPLPHTQAHVACVCSLPSPPAPAPFPHRLPLPLSLPLPLPLSLTACPCPCPSPPPPPGRAAPPPRPPPPPPRVTCGGWSACVRACVHVRRARKSRAGAASPVQQSPPGVSAQHSARCARAATSAGRWRTHDWLAAHPRVRACAHACLRHRSGGVPQSQAWRQQQQTRQHQQQAARRQQRHRGRQAAAAAGSSG
jgi:hypothetical protein